MTPRTYWTTWFIVGATIYTLTCSLAWVFGPKIIARGIDLWHRSVR